MGVVQESGGTTRGATFKNGTAGIVQSSKVHRFEGALCALVPIAVYATAGTVWDHRCWLRIAPSDGPVPPRHWLSLTVS